MPLRFAEVPSVDPHAEEAETLVEEGRKEVAGVIRSLLAGAIDYAGLFPPAGLAMRDAVAGYHAYRVGADSWALGRFVVPTSRLDEFASAATRTWAAEPRHGLPWRVSALVAGDATADLETILEFNQHQTAIATGGWAAAVDSAEARADSVEAVNALAQCRHPAIEMFVEVATGPASVPLLEAIASHRMAAKIRTGGVNVAQFPSPPAIAQFLHDCARLALPFKLTAGLHHPLRADHALTYEPDAERGTMFGFMNVLVAAAVARAGAEPVELAQLLDERDLNAFTIDAEAVTWRDRRVTTADIESVRERFALSFGSCSFEEPLSDLRFLGLL